MLGNKYNARMAVQTHPQKEAKKKKVLFLYKTFFSNRKAIKYIKNKNLISKDLGISNYS